jgi:hypothetical protein
MDTNVPTQHDSHHPKSPEDGALGGGNGATGTVERETEIDFRTCLYGHADGSTGTSSVVPKLIGADPRTYRPL